MSGVRRSVDSEVLARLIRWADGVPSFQPHHAVDGLFVAERYFQKEAHSEQVIYYVALLIGFWFWLDDRSDESLSASETAVAWEDIFSATESALLQAPPTTGPEGEYIWRLRAELEPLACGRADFEWWLTSVRYTAEGYRAEERFSRSGRWPEYSEYVEIGYWSSTLVSIIGTFSLVRHAGLATRRANVWITRLERSLSLFARLQNDLQSIEKDRAEGCMANAVFILGRFMPEHQAAEFVRRQMRGHEEVITQAFSALGDVDPLVRLGRAMLHAHEQWYAHRPERYA